MQSATKARRCSNLLVCPLRNDVCASVYLTGKKGFNLWLNAIPVTLSAVTIFDYNQSCLYQMQVYSLQSDLADNKTKTELRNPINGVLSIVPITEPLDTLQTRVDSPTLGAVFWLLVGIILLCALPRTLDTVRPASPILASASDTFGPCGVAQISSCSS